MQDLTGHVRSIIGREKEKARRDFLRLAGSPHRHIAAKSLHSFTREGRWNEWCPDGPGSNGINANLLFRQGLGERPGKSGNRALGRRVIKQVSTPLVGR